VAESELRFMRVLARMLGDQLARQELHHQQDVQREGLAAMALHDIRGPVSTVKGYAELLADDAGLTEAQRDHVACIERAGERLLRLADHLLDVSRAHGAPPANDHGPLDLGAVVAEAVESAAPGAATRGVELTGEVDDGLTVTGDSDALLRVAENLVGNAIKYTPAGGHVTVRAGREGAGVLLAVSDTGHGIPEAEQERVFESFYRASNSRDAAPGTGLGLAVCRRIVAEHGGSLTLASSEGQGTTVTVALAGCAAS
jgi:signal transduction histidine kinase